MTTTLIVSAHPARAGFAQQMVSRLKGIKGPAGRGVEAVNPCDEDPLSFLKFEGKDDITPAEGLQIYQDQISRADEIFFIFRCWGGDCPSIMRNWFVHVFSKGFAFTYGKRRPEGVLGGKDCYVIMTTGTPALICRITGVTRAMRRIWSATGSRFCGMRLKAFVVIDGRDIKDRNKAGALARFDRLAG